MQGQAAVKAILEFNLDEPDDALAHMRCIKALDMALVIFSFKEHLLSLRRDNPDKVDAQGILKVFTDYLEEYGVRLGELMR